MASKLAAFEKSQSTINSKPWKTTSYIIGLLVSVKCGAYRLRHHLQNCLWIPIKDQIFGTKMTTSGKFQSEYNWKLLKKQLLLEALQVPLKFEHIELYKFPLPKCPCIQVSRINVWHQINQSINAINKSFKTIEKKVLL